MADAKRLLLFYFSLGTHLKPGLLSLNPLNKAPYSKGVNPLLRTSEAL
jgi:hypothetical protein